MGRIRTGNRQVLDRPRGIMKVLHILKSVPDETVQILFQNISRETETSVVELYDDELDWQALVDNLFENDKIICWW